MPFKLNVTKPTVCLFLSTWVIALSLCGFGAFVPAFLGLPHHNLHPTDAECEQACLARSVTHHDATIGQPVGMPLQSELLSGVNVAYPLPSDAKGLSPLCDTLTHYPASTKRYQLISTYRL